MSIEPLSRTATPPADSPPKAPDGAVKKTLRQQWRSWTKPPRRLTFTRAGKFFMLLTLGVGAGALNTGNNLLFLLLGMMLSAIIASGVLSEGILRKLKGYRRLPRRVFARTPSPGAFKLHNPRSYLSLNIEISELNPQAIAGPLQGQHVGTKDIPFWKFWLTDDFSDERYVAIARCFEVAPNSKQELATRYIFPERGRYKLPGMRFATRFPFGLFHKVAEWDDEVEVVVFPEPVNAQDWVGDVAARFGDLKRHKAGQGEEFFGLRDWREGEDPRQIHWRSSARRDQFVVREFEQEEQRAVQFVLVQSSGQAGALAPSQLKRFELGLSKLSGLLQSLHHERYRTGLSLEGKTLEPSQTVNALDEMLSELATVTLRAGTPSALTLPEATPYVGQRGQELATVGVGFAHALALSGLEFELTLTLDELEP